METEQTTLAAVYLWFATGGMVFGTAAFLYLGVKSDGSKAHHYIGSALITLFASLAYVVMASGAGTTIVEAADGDRIFYVARYLDWAVTTPLLLVGLAYVALGSLQRNPAVVGGLVLADLLMIFFGYLAGLNGGGGRYVWYILSTLFFLAILGLIWGPLRSAAEAEPVPESRGFRFLALWLTVLWIGYPLLWLFGTEGTGAIGTTSETFWFMVLDLLAKVGFGFAVLSTVRRTADASSSSSSGPATATARPSRVA